MTHFWPHDSRFSLCGLAVRGLILSSDPSCQACRDALQIGERYVREVETKTQRDFRMDLATSALAPELYRARAVLDGYTPKNFPTLELRYQEFWYEVAGALLSICPAPEDLLETERDYKEFAAKLARAAFSLVKR